MKEIILALGRSLRSLTRTGIFWHLIWPGIFATVLWTVVAVMSWTFIVEGVVAWIDGLSWVGGWLDSSEVAAGVLVVLVKIAVALAFVPLIYVTAAILVAVVALPMMLERVARRDYADLEMRRGGSNMGSVWNALVATGLFLGALLLSLPFWLLPGVGLVVPVLLTGWLNQRAFGYDALMMHADREELGRLRVDQRMPMLVLGGGTALLAYVPLVNLLAPAFSGLSFVHFMLESLRRDRTRNGVTILDPQPSSLPRISE
ncbi:EI24 domain-containing protein [Azoarcus sp. L1K30]|uniref:EI24 domain-containing protein n=1 Tax=Azoarcus sp. L1K30 TaxID=2820277 RepID=UPI001B82C266|nr:EI24 domain-containing protein [Azoarcus sp. L1K30]MBR0568415.1 EI24 domain-containing protein [Azoarcus sp. L1K30]